MKTRVLAVLTLVGLLVACRDVTDPANVSTLHPLMDRAPAASVWASIASTAVGRQQHAAVTGSDGRIFVFEGNGDISWVRSSEVYDPAAGSWSSIASPGAWCCGGAARGGDGRMYLVGGENETFPTSDVKAYDPAANSWTTVGPLSKTRDVLAVASGSDGRVYAIGGAEDGDSRKTLSSVEVYDPATNVWSDVAPMSLRRWYHAAATGADGRIYVFGGFSSGFTAVASAEVYNPATDTWSPIAPMPETRYAHAAVAGGDGLIYIMGGIVNGGGDGKSVITYDPATDTWSTAPSLNVGRAQLGATLGLDGRIFATGGSDPNGGVTNTAEAFATIAPQAPANQAPFALASADQTLQCLAGEAKAILDASGSSDPDQDPLTFEWLEGSTLIATAVIDTVRFALGTHALTLRVTDTKHASAEDQLNITVADTKAPVVHVRRLDAVLWPADQMLHLVARLKAKDECDKASLNVTVTSNQTPRKDRWGHIQQDWKVLANRYGGFDVYVRAELESTKSDRVYAIKGIGVDGSQNSSTATTPVTVPRRRPEHHGW